jgi:SPP1 family predicted phage head-tail adaptor
LTYDNELFLISNTYAKDNIGNQIPSEVKTPVLCSVKSVSRNEFYNAATIGLNPSVVFVIHGYEYDGQTNIEYEGERYKVLRTYSVNFEELELTAEKVIS